MLRGIDISGHQSGIDISAIDCDFVIVKATGGDGFVNPDFRRQADQVLSSGKMLGLYHYARDHGYEGDAYGEAIHFLSHVADYVGKALMCLDWEADALDLPIGWAQSWMDTVAAETGCNTWFYSGASFVNSADCRPIANRPLWMASYLYRYEGVYGFVDDPDLTWGSGSFPCVKCYQYSSTTHLDGYGGTLDVNVFYGDRAEFASYYGGAPGGSGYVEYTHRVEDMCNYAVAYAADDSHGYTQDMQGRWGQDRDCATFIWDSAHIAGFDVGWGPDETRYTGTIIPVFEQAGWTAVEYDGNPKRGYILWKPGHVELHLGDGMNAGAHCSETGDAYGEPGDQTGDEISVTPNPGGWTIMLIPPAEIPMLKEDDLKPVINEGGEVRRLYHPDGGGDHLYTTSKAEIEKLVNEEHWADEGVMFTAPCPGRYPVFRMLNPNSIDHFWTTSYSECERMQAAGWRYEGVFFFVNQEGAPCYRLFNPNAGDHFWTMKPEERDQRKAEGWVDEGVAWRV